MDRISSYSDIFELGHKALEELFQGDVTIEEKVDGSQISFGRTGNQLFMRSKGKQLNTDEPEKMFSAGVASVKDVIAMLPENWIFRGEYLRVPKHNTLSYDRVPRNHIILFDIDCGNQDYLPYPQKAKIASELGFEVVPLLYHGTITSVDQVRSFLAAESCLGGVKPEGVVIKNYSRFAADKKILMGKYVRTEFKEVHAKEWKEANLSGVDVIHGLIQEYKTAARWEKAFQHLRDAGQLAREPRDIGLLLKEVPADVRKECEDEIKKKLWDWAWPKIQRGVKAGLPEWYKNKLLEGVLTEK